MWASPNYPARWIHSYTVTVGNVNGTQCFSQVLPDPVDPIEGPFPLAHPLFMFDSTRFRPASTITITITAIDNLGGTGSYTTSAVPVKNCAYISEHPDAGGDPVGVVVNDVNLRYLTYGPDGDWTPMDFINGLAGMNLVAYAGHGTPTYFFAAHVWSDPDTDYPTYVYPFGDDAYVGGHPGWLQQAGVEPYRIPQMGVGFPPFNSTGQPPINLATVISCGTGQCQDFIRFCLPYENAFGYWLEDQAYTGFVPSIYLKDEGGITKVLYGSLSGGNTLFRARNDLLNAGFSSVPEGGDPGHLLTLSDVPIYGDDRVRIATVYTRDYRDPAGWYIMPIP